MSEGKTIIFGGGESQSIASMLPALLQNKGIDSTALAALMNNNRGGLLGNNGLGDIIALIIVAAIFGNGNGGGLFGGGNNTRNAETDMLMQTLNRNGVDISQLAQAVNCSTDQILAGINSVASSICSLGNQMGQNTNQIITALLQGNNSLSSQIASCCCDLKGAIASLGNGMERGFSSLAFETQRQTCDISKSIESATSRILEGQRNAELRELNRDIAERDRRISEQATAINNYQQTQTFAAMLQNATAPLAAGINGLQSDVDGIKCRLPKTEVIPATPEYVPINRGINLNYAPYNCLTGFGFPYNNGNGSFF